MAHSLACCAGPRNFRLGSAQGGQIGGQAGGLLSQLTGIPGLGQIGSLIGSLFGPSPHYSSCGILYDQTSADVNMNAQMLAAMGEPISAAFMARTGAFAYPQVWPATSPRMGNYLAALLNRSDLKGVSDTASNQTSWLNGGPFCAALQVQGALAAHFDQTGQWLRLPGAVLVGIKYPPLPPAPQAGPMPPVPSPYASDPQGNPATPASHAIAPGSPPNPVQSGAGGGPSPPASILSSFSDPVVLIGGAVLLLFFMKER